jgi:membrane protease YdiL (CAAX protease family)
MQGKADISTAKIAAVLVGFPVVSTLLSLLLLRKDLLAWTGLEFHTAFWMLITLWYAAQIAILGLVLKSSGANWKDIGYGFDARRTAWFVGGYLLFAFALVAFVEFALGSVGSDPAKLQALSDLSNLTPKTTASRVVFVFMGLAAGLCEDLVFSGFAIRALQSRGLNPWLAAVLATIPFVFQHGVKSIAQVWWFAIWGLVFGAVFIGSRRLWINIVIHWLVILSAVLAVLQALR